MRLVWKKGAHNSNLNTNTATLYESRSFSLPQRPSPRFSRSSVAVVGDALFNAVSADKTSPHPPLVVHTRPLHRPPWNTTNALSCSGRARMARFTRLSISKLARSSLSRKLSFQRTMRAFPPQRCARSLSCAHWTRPMS